MTRNRLMIGAGCALLVLVLAAFGYNRTQSNKVAAGVTIGGIDVSGLSRADAETKLSQEIERSVQQPIVVLSGEKQRTLKPEKSRVRVDIPQMVDSAIEQSNKGFFVASAARRITGSKRTRDIPVEITYSQPAVRRFVRSAGKSFNQTAQDATLKYTASGLDVTPARQGRTLRVRDLTKAIVARLEQPTSSRRIRAPMRRTAAKLTTRAQLAKKYPTVLIVDRSGFKLRLYKKLKLDRTYPIAVGQAGLETPPGLYSINDRQIDPAWHVPNSDWAGDLAGTVVPPGPGNPLVARWLGIYDGVGIHGTDDIASLGTAASHGCIRMNPTDVIALFPLVPIGTPVYIA